ncbi:MAG: O-antigen ligase family protein, partial [Planctomycetaceae bacterium]|nr:O-antigen ligase family protein [Planctomycetaceae bacterium]
MYRSSADAFSRTSVASRPILLWCVDLGLFAAVFVLPFVMGGRQAIGEMTLVVIACWTTLTWLLLNGMRSTAHWRLTALDPILIAGVILCVLQTSSLPSAWMDALSPHLGRLLPLWRAEGAAAFVSGPWTTVSLVPAATRSSSCCVASIVMLFIVAVQRIDTISDARRMMRAIAVAATGMAVFGSIQFLLGNGRFFWVYEHPFTHTRDYAKGAFTNPNHFANYLAMSVPILLAWYALPNASTARRIKNPYPSLQERLTERSGTAALIGLCLVSVGILLSQSRGGLVTACIGAITTLVLLLRARLLSFRTASTIGGIALAALGSLTLFGSHIESLIEQNFHELVSGDMQQLDRGEARQKIWAAAVEGISDYTLLGTGLSTHREVYWTYFDHPEIDGEYSHAENGPLQLTLETGFVGLGLAAAAVLIVAFWCVHGLWKTSTPDAAALLAAIAGALSVNVVHSITDFVWYVPACMTVVAFLAACASRLNRMATPQRLVPHPPASVWSRSRGVIAALGVLLISAWMVEVKRPSLAAESFWFDYIRMVKGTKDLEDAFDRDELQRHKLATVMAAADADPSDCRIQLRAASAALTLFHDGRKAQGGAMSLANIREAARASEWESQQQLQDWLSKPGVIGDRTHLEDAWRRTQRALAECPLLAEGYIRLGELAWIQGATQRQEDALLVQALRVRPYAPLVHFAVGREAWLRGKETAAMEHWNRAFAHDVEYQQLIIKMLSDSVPAQFFVDHFSPDTAALSRIREAYRNAADPESFQSVSRLLAERLSADAAAAVHHQSVNLWRKAHEVYLELGEKEGARQTAIAAV